VKEWNEFDPSEIVHKYRQFVYETGAAESQDSGVRGQGSVKKVSGVRAQETGKKGIDPKIVEKARKKGYR